MYIFNSIADLTISIYFIPEGLFNESTTKFFSYEVH